MLVLQTVLRLKQLRSHLTELRLMEGIQSNDNHLEPFTFSSREDASHVSQHQECILEVRKISFLPQIRTTSQSIVGSQDRDPEIVMISHHLTKVAIITLARIISMDHPQSISVIVMIVREMPGSHLLRDRQNIQNLVAE